MKFPQLNQVGECSECKETYGLIKIVLVWSIPEHSYKRKPCRGSSMSAANMRLRILSHRESLEVANFVKQDDGRCLILLSHSLACGDGDRCHAIRRNLARSMAEYYLRYVSKTA